MSNPFGIVRTETLPVLTAEALLEWIEQMRSGYGAEQVEEREAPEAPR